MSVQSNFGLYLRFMSASGFGGAGELGTSFDLDFMSASHHFPPFPLAIGGGQSSVAARAPLAAIYQ